MMISSLPQYWITPKLSEVCQINPRERAGLAEDDLVSFVPMAAVSEVSASIVAAESRVLKDVQRGFTPFREGDVLFAKITPSMENGKAAIARNLVNQCGYGSTEFHVIHPSALVLPEWILAIVRTAEFRRAAAASFQGAVGQQRVPASFLENFRIPLPPIGEQRRIVTILQEAEEIRRLRDEATRKASLLSPALFFDRFVRGKDHTFQPLHKVADVVSGVALGRKQKGITTEVPYLRVANVQAGRVDLSEVKTTPATDQEVEQFRLEKGDILVTEGGDFDKLGRGCLWEGQIDPCIHQNHVFRVRPFPGKLNPVFFAHYLQSAKATHYFLRCAKRTTNLASINLTQLKALPVPVVSFEDQERFGRDVHEAERCGTDDSGRLYDALVSSLSAQAFSGQLTEAWREANRESLAGEAHERDAALKAVGSRSVLALRRTIETAREIIEQPQDGVYSDLGREQRDLLIRIQQRFGRSRTARYFTAQSVSESLEGPLRRNPQGIAVHLAVFAARGLVIPVSREEQTEDTGEFVFGNAYRLPLTESGDVSGGEQQEPIASDHVRLREMEWLLAEVEREGALA